MTAMTVMPGGVGDWTVADLEQLPDDGLQYELIDGMLLVTPAPNVRHQVSVLNLAVHLRAVCPKGMRVLVAPVDWQPENTTSLEPDVLVIWDRDLDAKNVTYPLPLAVEILSPSTRRKDLLLKRSKYEEGGIASYWIVDPAEPSILALELRDGAYAEAGRAAGDETIRLQQPFPVEIVPARLLD